MEVGASGKPGHLVQYLAEEEVVVEIDLAITQHHPTEETFAQDLRIKNWKNVTIINALVLFFCLNDM